MAVGRYVRIAAVVGVVTVLGAGAAATANDNQRRFSEQLSGFEEAPMTLSTPGVGTFRAKIDKATASIDYTLTFSGLESNVTQAHIHFGGPWEGGPGHRLPVHEPRQRARRHPDLPGRGRHDHGHDRRC